MGAFKIGICTNAVLYLSATEWGLYHPYYQKPTKAKQKFKILHRKIFHIT